ncbi:hypothetical protein, partial [Klebsiella michiganensis]|uniref:hypothetical protein n=1 Tax=Klebsiella michiganensis TaxID=1134687 RepID=UPI0034D345AC
PVSNDVKDIAEIAFWLHRPGSILNSGEWRVHLMKCLFITLFNSSIVRPIAKFTLMAISISSIDVRPAPAGVIFVCKKTQY